jgi:NAD(P)-dependent dehydrogenase (short-subunit alcohol dehydrogenase family)
LASFTSDGITANCAVPGYILTNLQQHDSPEALAGMTRFRIPEPKTVEQGAATSVLLATSPLLNGIGGRYFEDCNEALVVDDSSGWIEGVAPWALDPANAERLWEVSAGMLANA